MGSGQIRPSAVWSNWKSSAHTWSGRSAMARKMCVLSWHLLTRGEDYAYQMPIVTAKKLRKVELTAGAPRRRSSGNLNGANREERRPLERRSAETAESAYQRNVADWQRQQQQRSSKAVQV